MLKDMPMPPSDDGLPYAEGGAWSEEKHNLVFLYDSLFSTGMKEKWNSRVYIDLYSGPGIVQVRRTSRLLWGSPLLALQVKHPFDKYIFCDENPPYIDALKERATRLAPRTTIEYVAGDCNRNAKKIRQLIPTSSSALSLCFIDPYDLSIEFETIRTISLNIRVDFLILLALGTDAGRNEANYTNPENQKLDRFFGQSEWRARWAKQSLAMKFPQFVAEEYARQMTTVGYLKVPFHKMRQVRDDGNHLLYRLALFSRNRLAYKYWAEVLKYSTPQKNLFNQD